MCIRLLLLTGSLSLWSEVKHGLDAPGSLCLSWEIYFVGWWLIYPRVWHRGLETSGGRDGLVPERALCSYTSHLAVQMFEVHWCISSFWQHTPVFCGQTFSVGRDFHLVAQSPDVNKCWAVWQDPQTRCYLTYLLFRVLSVRCACEGCHPCRVQSQAEARD